MTGKEPQELGDYVSTLRKRQSLSIRGLAALAKVDASWLSRLERDLIHSPDALSLYRLSRALEIDVSELYQAAGFADKGLPGLSPYLRSKYDLPDEAIAQLQAHFDLLNEKYHQQ